MTDTATDEADVTVEEWTPYDGPCPSCGSRTLGETALSHGTTRLDENDDPLYEENEIGQALVVHCYECDTRLYGQKQW